MNAIMEFLKWVYEKLALFAWGPATILLLLLTGAVFTVGTGFFQLRKIRLWWANTVGTLKGQKSSKEGVSAFQSACTALAATLGTGNIAGVATALAAGGPGAVFWMWVSAFFGTMTAYAENVLAGVYRGKNASGQPIGGAMFYIEQGLRSRPLAVAFSFLCLLGSLGMGNMAQANSIAQGMQDSFLVPPLATGLVVALLVALTIVGGIGRIGRVAERVVPAMAIVYTAGCLVVIAAHWQAIPRVVCTIVQQAFCLQAGAGGLAGYGVSRAVRIGIARGVCSNEAGLGTSVMANSAAGVTPVQQGMWGVFEVAVDTLFMCTITALCILCSGVYNSATYAAALGTPAFAALPNGSVLTANAFRTVFGTLGGVFVALSIVFFAFATLLGWSYYGTQAATYLWGERAKKGYLAVYLACIVLGCVAQLDLVWQISDTFNGLMALPNVLALLCLCPVVFRQTKKEIGRHRTKHNP